MHCYKNANSLALLLLLLWLLPLSVNAGAYSTQIKNVEISAENGSYLLSADLEFRLGNEARDALQNGVPLFWDVEILLKTTNKYWLDKTVAHKNMRYQIQYHALLKIYRVVITYKPPAPNLAIATGTSKSEQGRANSPAGNVYNFSTLATALDFMSAVKNITLTEMSRLPLGKPAYVRMKVSFDQDALPLPLRPIAYLDPEWYLSSEWTLWQLRK